MVIIIIFIIIIIVIIIDVFISLFIFVERRHPHSGAPYLISLACVSSETHNLQSVFRPGGTPLYKTARQLLIREIAVVSSMPSLQLKVVFQFEYYQHIDETSYHAIVLGHHPMGPCIRDIAMDPTRTPGVHQI